MKIDVELAMVDRIKDHANTAIKNIVKLLSDDHSDNYVREKELMLLLQFIVFGTLCANAKATNSTYEVRLDEFSQNLNKFGAAMRDVESIK